jgi:hypothetical protein
MKKALSILLSVALLAMLAVACIFLMTDANDSDTHATARVTIVVSPAAKGEAQLDNFDESDESANNLLAAQASEQAEHMKHKIEEERTARTVVVANVDKNSESLLNLQERVASADAESKQSGVASIQNDGTVLFRPKHDNDGDDDELHVVDSDGERVKVLIQYSNERTWYVSSSSNMKRDADAKHGTSWAPFAHVSDALGAASSGDTVRLVDGGRYEMDASLALGANQRWIGEGNPHIVMRDAEHAVLLADGAQLSGVTVVGGRGVHAIGVREPAKLDDVRANALVLHECAGHWALPSSLHLEADADAALDVRNAVPGFSLRLASGAVLAARHGGAVSLRIDGARNARVHIERGVQMRGGVHYANLHDTDVTVDADVIVDHRGSSDNDANAVEARDVERRATHGIHITQLSGSVKLRFAQSVHVFGTDQNAIFVSQLSGTAVITFAGSVWLENIGGVAIRATQFTANSPLLHFSGPRIDILDVDAGALAVENGIDFGEVRFDADLFVNGSQLVPAKKRSIGNPPCIVVSLDGDAHVAFNGDVTVMRCDTVVLGITLNEPTAPTDNCRVDVNSTLTMAIDVGPANVLVTVVGTSTCNVTLNGVSSAPGTLDPTLSLMVMSGGNWTDGLVTISNSLFSQILTSGLDAPMTVTDTTVTTSMIYMGSANPLELTGVNMSEARITMTPTPSMLASDAGFLSVSDSEFGTLVATVSTSDATNKTWHASIDNNEIRDELELAINAASTSCILFDLEPTASGASFCGNTMLGTAAFELVAGTCPINEIRMPNNYVAANSYNSAASPDDSTAATGSCI